MAPIAPKKRLLARQKLQRRLSLPLLTPRRTHRPDSTVSDTFLDSRSDLHLIRRSSFQSRIAKSSAHDPTRHHSSGVTKKRRRPNKKLVANLKSLGDALEDVASDLAAQEERGKVMDTTQRALGRVRHKSLKMRHGALKRKEKVVRAEMERFERSLAQLQVVGNADGSAARHVEMGAESGGRDVEETTAGTASAAPGATMSRWAVLRGFISMTMEQNPAFLPKT